MLPTKVYVPKTKNDATTNNGNELACMLLNEAIKIPAENDY